MYLWAPPCEHHNIKYLWNIRLAGIHRLQFSFLWRQTVLDHIYLQAHFSKVSVSIFHLEGTSAEQYRQSLHIDNGHWIRLEI